MEKAYLIKYFTAFLVAGLISLNGCTDPIWDFGYDGQLSGTILDNSGNIVSGRHHQEFMVTVLNENEITPLQLRIKSDGTYANSKLFPQSYDVILQGPFIGTPLDPVLIDLTGGKSVVKDFVVTPWITVNPPTISGSPTSTTVQVNYSVTGNGGKTPNLIEIYCSTVSWPSRVTGSGRFFHTRLVAVTGNQGTATIDGLQPGTDYFLRVGARAAGETIFNHGEQISFTTAAK
jgi:hypothetical protein